jgi:hypothetical protein
VNDVIFAASTIVSFVSHKKVFLGLISTEVQVKVTFDGTTTDEYDLETTKKRFQKYFRLEKAQIEKLFNGKTHTLKKNLSEASAMDLAFKIADVGCECSIEPMPNENDISQRADFVERRHIGNRRVKFRRPPRPGAIVPDRRNTNGRRSIDPPD